MKAYLRRVPLLPILLFGLLPTSAMAQASIAGLVKDTTGAVLPGVTVEASSPALIEKVHTAVTDDQGRYIVVDLRPGTYAVTFSLPGFSTMRREGIELTGTFTATVNIDMSVGAVAETVTVSGQSPLVDIQNVVQQRVVTAEVVAALPTSRTFQTIAAVVPGISTTTGVGVANQDVGGSMGDQSQSLSIHGSRSGDQQQMIDGFYMNGVLGPTQQALYMDVGSTEEIRYDLGAISAEIITGGVHINFIPKEGGNRFTGSVFGTFTNHALQADNTTSELLARGLGANNSLDKVWDFNPGYGGPIRRDTLWFYGSTRFWGTNNRVAGIWYDKDPYDNVYTPDLGRQGIEDTHIYSGSVRLTWQLDSKNKLAVYHLNQQGRCLCHRDISSSRAPEAARRARSPVMHMEIAHWTAPLTNRLLLDVGGALYTQMYSVEPQPETWRPEVLSLTELSTMLNFRTSNIGHDGFQMRKLSPRASLSYVTGSHVMKLGADLQHGTARQWLNVNGNINLQLLNGAPRSLTVFATPYNVYTNNDAAAGIYGSDQWTVKRLTINAGVRWDYHRSTVPEQHLPAVQFVGPRDFAAIPNVPRWTDLGPRLGLAYDISGRGRTAVKLAINRYVLGEGTGFAQRVNPVNASVNRANRTWTDLNGDFLPQCDFLNPDINGECGSLSDRNFGKLGVTTRVDDAIRIGYGIRPYNWEASLGLQHELTRGVSVEASYNGRWYGNFTVPDNLAVSPSDYDPYCIIVPADSRLPGGGGNRVCDLYDVKLAKFGRVDNFITMAGSFGRQRERYDGMDAVINVRMPHGGRVSGGVSVGRSARNNCFIVDTPQELRFCDVKPPFLLNGRGYAIYPLPWDLQASATFQTIPGPEIRATYVAQNSEIAPSLGRDLASGARGTAQIELVRPGTMYGDRLYQVDFRLTRVFRIGSRRLQGNMNLYNFLNASPVLVQNNTYGPAWQRPIAVLPGRLLKFDVQLDF